MAESRYDVFCSYQSRDRIAVERVAGKLRAKGLRIYLDRWYLPAGQPWPQALERALDDCGAVAVFLGPEGMGPWQQREQYLALNRQARDQTFPVIPVVLPGGNLPLGFLGLGTWVDLRSSIEDERALTVFEAGIRGQAPGPNARDDVDSAPAGVRPYRGLEPFREEDAPLFFGRESFTDQLSQAVDRGFLVAVVGASGSGKSSVVKAGLVPRLRAGGPGKPVWEILSMVPAERPLHSLAAALVPVLEPVMSEVDRMAEVNKLAGYLKDGAVSLADATARCLEKQPGTNRLLLVVDQWEELYTLSTDPADVRRLLDEILRATAAGKMTVVLTMRGDFFGHALAHRGFADRLAGAQVNLGPMTRSELQRAITRPLEAAHLQLEPGLVDRILDDVGDEPGHLPLLEFVMGELWERRSAGSLRHEAYVAMGGLKGAIAARADRVWAELTPAEQATARRLLIQMVRPGEGTEDTRQRTFLPVTDSLASGALRRLAKVRLVVTSRDTATGRETAEVAHEALIRRWALLRGWVNEDRDFLRARARIATAAAQWESDGRERTRLLPAGLPLTEAETLLASRRADLDDASFAFIEASAARARRGRLAVRGSVTAIIVVLATLVGVSVASARRATQQAEAAKRIAAAADFDLATLYLERDDRLEAPRAIAHLTRALSVWPKEWRTEYRLKTLVASRHWFVPRGEPLRQEAQVIAASFSPDGKRVVTASEDGSARVWDAETGKLLSQPLRRQEGNDVEKASFSADCKRVLMAVWDHVRAWDVETGRPLSQPFVYADSVMGGNLLAFSRDGKRVVTATADFSSYAYYSWTTGKPLKESEVDRSAQVWDVETGQLLGQSLRHKDWVVAASLSPNGSRVVTVTGASARVWDVATGKPLGQALRHEKDVEAANFSPDGTRVVTASRDWSAQVWDATTGKPLGQRLRHEKDVMAANFSPDGKLVVTVSGNSAYVWNAVTGKRLGGPLLHKDRVVTASISPDDTLVVTASADGGARVWMSLSGEPLGQPLRHDDGDVVMATFSPNGERVMTVSKGMSVQVWDAETAKTLEEPLRHRDDVLAASFSPDDGRRVVTASEDKSAQVWDAETGKKLGEPLRHDGAVLAASFSPDGKRVITASRDGTAQLWDAETGKRLAEPLRHDGGDVVMASFSFNGERVVTASEDKSAQVWDAGTGKKLGQPLRHAEAVLAASFSPDGRRVVTASEDHSAQVWEAETGRKLGQSLRHDAWVLAASFSPDGRRVVTASRDGTAQLWDAETGRRLAEPLRHRDDVLAASFSPDGRRVVTASEDESAQVWDTETGRKLGQSLLHKDKVLAASFNPDGSRVITASGDKCARVWDTETGKLLGEPMCHESDVLAASFSPDGRRVVTASKDDSARIWTQPTIEGVFPTWARRWFEMVGSRRFDEQGALVTAPTLAPIPRDASTGGPFLEFVQWFSSSGPERKTAPGSRRTVEAWLRDRLAENSEPGLLDAYRAMPRDRGVLAAIDKFLSASGASREESARPGVVRSTPSKPRESNPRHLVQQSSSPPHRNEKQLTPR